MTIIENGILLIGIIILFLWMYILINPIFTVFAFVGIVILSILFLFILRYEGIGLIILIVYIGAISILFLFCVTNFTIVDDYDLIVNRYIAKFGLGPIIVGIVSLIIILNMCIYYLWKNTLYYTVNINDRLAINLLYLSINSFAAIGELMYDFKEWGGIVLAIGVFLFFMLFVIYGLTHIDDNIVLLPDRPIGRTLVFETKNIGSNPIQVNRENC